mmetsp:Transcript_51713/g.80740  ORF Transcript_51713/g.80740 Transcript_51713/m.80740 type:complete len:232 (+) Transcript_51713:173-868(+)|eukprot:CAMPEP_0169083016 /NCGR_PEP_ID=MMETSP1015-20121227/11853_1 /TAXON_ID=342587 /ORGANISM="Karlodinium micrum, Strain CCMP2283" /LENGTH=231 /DNA_ID=CAMNT_0009142911 /DNA_START=175 /DNA_END=870 /DNA_ORIENTATION=-
MAANEVKTGGTRGYPSAVGASRPSTGPSSVRSGAMPRVIARSPSPMAGRINMNELDHSSIIALSQTCTEELTNKMREKDALVSFLAELKKKKLQFDARSGKKKREVDTAIVQTIELEKKLQTATNTNKMMSAELAGLRKDNERLENDVEYLRKALAEGTEKFDIECSEVERVRRMLHSYRKEINAEAKNRDNVQQDLRASRTAQSLMINRLDDMAKRNLALKRCVANTFNA